MFLVRKKGGFSCCPDCLVSQVSDNKQQQSQEMSRAKELAVLRAQRQLELEMQYQVELKNSRERARIKEGAAVRENFLAEIRRWYIEYRDANGKFPDLPPEDEGGSKIIHTMPVAPAESPTPGVVKKVYNTAMTSHYSTSGYSILTLSRKSVCI